jgi:hypothetical protein
LSLFGTRMTFLKCSLSNTVYKWHGFIRSPMKFSSNVFVSSVSLRSLFSRSDVLVSMIFVTKMCQLITLSITYPQVHPCLRHLRNQRLCSSFIVVQSLH